MEAPNSLILRTLNSEMLDAILFRLNKPLLGIVARVCKHLASSVQLVHAMQEKVKKRFSFWYTPSVSNVEELSWYNSIDANCQVIHDKGIVLVGNDDEARLVCGSDLLELNTLVFHDALNTTVVLANGSTFVMLSGDESYSVRWTTGEVNLFTSILNPRYYNHAVIMSCDGTLISFYENKVVEYNETLNCWDFRCYFPDKFLLHEPGVYRVSRNSTGIFVFFFKKEAPDLLTEPLLEDDEDTYSALTLRTIIKYDDTTNKFAVVHTTGDFPVYHGNDEDVYVEIHCIQENFVFLSQTPDKLAVYVLTLTNIHDVYHGLLEKLPLPDPAFDGLLPAHARFLFHVKRDTLSYYYQGVGSFELHVAESGLAIMA